MTKMVRMDKIRLDGMTQFRDEINQNVVKQYTECMLDGADFPPVKCTFDGSNYWLCDGFHRYFASQAVGYKEIMVDYKPGTQEDAQDIALGANGTHGLPPSKATKTNKVEFALQSERHAGKSDREIAKLCEVSATFVATVRNPEAKERQAKNRVASAAKQAEVKLNSDVQAGDVIPTEQVKSDFTPSVGQDFGPDDDELKAMELAEQADREIFAKLLESDDALQVAHKEILRLNHLVAQKEVRIAALMNEKNAAVKHAQAIEKQLKKAAKK